MPECKVLTCCDLDDFPQTSSSAGNCPTGYYWNGLVCVRGIVPENAMLGEDGEPLLSEDGQFILTE